MEKPVAADCVSHNARRKFLTMAVSTMLIDMGFDNVERQCLETLCEMFQSCKFNFTSNFPLYSLKIPLF